MLRVRRDSPLAPEVAALLERHLALMWASSPAESVHALAADDLMADDVAFFSLRDGKVVLGIGALRRIDARHAEIKSMHIVAEARGRGLARIMLDQLVAEARVMGYTRLSLETGVEAVFAPARALYRSAGFAICAPFQGYATDPNSVFMTCALA
ncbi:MAG: GNAT family N-acetyltransferase [Pseudorhodobacter sp.]|nr:GNAT family N-acetyltransferase [Pseudorhodobacter sp.]